MKRISSIHAAIEQTKPIVLATGVFDGLHLGHQRLIESSVQKANISNGQAWVLTFDRHPSHTLHPKAAPPRILTPSDQHTLLKEMGIHGILVLPFTNELANWPAKSFIARLMEGFPTLQHMVVGPDWKFGRNAEGDIGLLENLSQQQGFSVQIIEAIKWNGKRISSTRIREALAKAHMRDVHAMLGRPYQLTGTVVHGRKAARALGYPTANLEPSNEIIPPPGIYASMAWIQNKRVLAAGYRPQGTSNIFEVYLIDHTANLYGKTLTVDILEHIRNDIDFESNGALQNRIERDVQKIRDSWGFGSGHKKRRRQSDFS